ncbi:MAG: bifunctional riboflavin kinase/FAD synthetase [Actinomycetales bacterium]|nr:MAG: bifunctional riboflavin kinase/FAD synthetase [Actinomycetales bacterium]
MWRAVEGSSTTEQRGPSAVTIGSFDGVHRGHQAVLAATRAASGGLPVVAVTFDPHPMAVLAPEREPRRLTTIERRVALLHEHGADEVRVLAFDREMAAWSPEEFVERTLVDALSASTVAVGENFRFGSRASGTCDVLRRLGAEHDFTVTALSLAGDETPFSSSLVRSYVADGELAAAAQVLGRPHEVSGIVSRGDQRGRELGFPTANVPVDESYAVPPDGVYAGRVVTGSESLPAAISVGTNPTFEGVVGRRVESYVIDHGHDLALYDQHVRVELVKRLRGMVAFGSVELLVAQMHRDVRDARTVLG